MNNGFPEPAAWDQIANRDAYEPATIRDSMVFGTPEQVIAKLKQYQAAGVDQFNLYLMNGDEEDILDIYGREIIPALRGLRPARTEAQRQGAI